MPWEAVLFDCIIYATSLGHSLVVDESFRVLKSGGKIVVWESCFDNMPKKDSLSPSVKSIDKYPMFHFSEESFENSFIRLFKIARKICIADDHFLYYMLINKIRE